MIASSVAKSIARSVAQAVSSVGGGGVATPFVIIPSTATPVAGVDTTWSTNAGDLGTPVLYTWDFGDGTIPVTGATPSHYFVGLGPYTVTCTVTYNDASTDTDTQVISPTAPVATSGQTLIAAELFEANVSGSALGAFDEFFGSTTVNSVSLGAKLAGTSGVGWAGYQFGACWAGLWDIGDPYTDTTIWQVEGWFRFDRYPDKNVYLTMAKRVNGSLKGLALTSTGTLVIDYPATTTIHATPIPLDTWFWVGMAIGETDSYEIVNAKYYLKFIGSSATLLHSGIFYTPGQTDFGVGVVHVNGNADYGARVSYAALRQLATLADSGYGGDVVPPQDENHIYQVNPATGSDTNDGITAPWQTVTKVNLMMDQYYKGVISTAPAATVKAECGLGSWLVVDTGAALLDVGNVGLKLSINSIWLKKAAGQAIAEIQSYVIVDPVGWSATGGYLNIYQVAVSEPEQTTVFGNNVCFEPVASLAALDAAAGGASWLDVAGQLLHIKTLGLTNPTSDGITYIYGRHRTTGDTVGFPSISVAAADCRISDFKIWYTANNQNGNYAIGDITGFSGLMWVERCSSKYSDKHGICFTINAVDSEIFVDDCDADLGWTYPYTSFMLTGSGNIHTYEGCTSDVPLLLARSAVGAPVNTHGNGPGSFYSHGSGGVFTAINVTDCVFAGSVEAEFAHADLNVNGGSSQFVRGGNAVNLDDVDLRDVIPINGTVNNIRVVTGNTYTTVWDMSGSLTNSTFDLRTLGYQAIGLWRLTGATTFTGNTIRFAAGQSSPVIKDSAAADIVSWNNNTYYIEAAAIFAKAFDDGGGADDYTFAQWQALGYDAASTRIDP